MTMNIRFPHLTLFYYVGGVYHSRNSGSPTRSKRSSIVTNPIYEGEPIYETIDPCISNPPPLPPLLPNTKCPPFAVVSRADPSQVGIGSARETTLAVESPYNNSNIDPNLQIYSPSFPSPLHEEYIIMTSAGALGRSSR